MLYHPPTQRRSADKKKSRRTAQLPACSMNATRTMHYIRKAERREEADNPAIVNDVDREQHHSPCVLRATNAVYERVMGDGEGVPVRDGRAVSASDDGDIGIDATQWPGEVIARVTGTCVCRAYHKPDGKRGGAQPWRARWRRGELLQGRQKRR